MKKKPELALVAKSLDWDDYPRTCLTLSDPSKKKTLWEPRNPGPLISSHQASSMLSPQQCFKNKQTKKKNQPLLSISLASTCHRVGTKTCSKRAKLSTLPKSGKAGSSLVTKAGQALQPNRISTALPMPFSTGVQALLKMCFYFGVE